MKFRFIYLLYCAIVSGFVVMADARGWILTALTKGGVGRSYSAVNHK
jgi:hypothetical protein